MYISMYVILKFYLYMITYFITIQGILRGGLKCPPVPQAPTVWGLKNEHGFIQHVRVVCETQKSLYLHHFSNQNLHLSQLAKSFPQWVLKHVWRCTVELAQNSVWHELLGSAAFCWPHFSECYLYLWGCEYDLEPETFACVVLSEYVSGSF